MTNPLHVLRGLSHAELDLFATSGRVQRFPGVRAAIVPATPERSLFNSVVPDDAASLLASYDELSRTYLEAGVKAWTVWIDPGDVTSAEALAARGHKLDSQPVLMFTDMGALTLADPAELEVRETSDLATVARINDAAYGFKGPAFSAALVALPPRWHAYLATVDGEAIACALCFESEEGDCGISGVATLPTRRGGGLASRVLSFALATARGRGCTTTSLQASPSGKPVYTRLGYRDYGAMGMWELRRV